jgi:hypothetical protein
MKPKFLLIIFTLSFGLLLLIGSPSRADSPTPTPEAEPVEKGPVKIQSNIVEMAQGTVSPEDENSDLTPAQFSIDPAQAAEISAAGIELSGNKFSIANTSSAEGLPAVGRGATGYYLVVYERAGSIYGQRVSPTGQLAYSPFYIGSGYNPDVACDRVLDLCAVVYKKYLSSPSYSYAIVGKTVYGSYNASGQTIGMENVIADYYYKTEMNPAVACNCSDHSCLVVYEYEVSTSDHDIYAQRIQNSPTIGMFNQGARFTPATASATEVNPAVAWGGSDNNYLVVWSVMYNNDHYRVIFQHIHDTHQTSGDQWQHGPTWLINPGTHDSDQTSPAVAYNFDDQKYLVGFSYAAGAPSGLDIRAERVWGTGQITTGDPFLIAYFTGDERHPAVTYDGGSKQFVAVFSNEYLSSWGIGAQAIKGVHNWSGSNLDGSWLVLDSLGASSSYVNYPDIISSNSGNFLAAWDYKLFSSWGGDADDIYGYLLSGSGSDVYLPLVIRN